MIREEALEFIRTKVANQNIVKHMLATEAVMRALARELRARYQGSNDRDFDEEEWGLAGLLHDGDYSESVSHQKQGIVISGWLEEAGFIVSEEVRHAMAAHNASNTGVQPLSKMDWSLFACDSLTGLIVASVLVLPSRKLADLSHESVLKKFKQLSFAKGTRREDIKTCEAQLGTSLEEFVKISLEAMQTIAPELGL